MIVPRHHRFAPAGVHAAHRLKFVHFRHASRHIIFGHFHHHVDTVARHGVARHEAADHFHAARFAKTFHEFIHEHLTIFHGHAWHSLERIAHHDDVAFRARHAHGHHRHAFHQGARDLIDAIVAHLAHVHMIFIRANVHLAFHGGHRVGKFHHHHEHARTA